MQTVSSDDLFELFSTSLKGRGIQDFWFTGPFVWKTLQLFETREKLQTLEIHAYAARQAPFKLVLPTPIGKVTCAVGAPGERPTPSCDERHLPSIEWLICDWISNPKALRVIGLGKFRRRLMQIIQGQTTYPFSFDVFQDLAPSFPQEKSLLPQLILQLMKMQKGEFSPTGKAAKQLDPIEEMQTNLAAFLDAPPPPAEPDHLQILPIPCDRHGRALRILAREEVEELTRRYRDFGDIAARNTIALSNVGLTYSSVKRYYFDHETTKQDLVQEGYIGLFRSIEDFDPTRKLQFSTYGTQWVRAKMGRFLEKEWYAHSAPITEARGARDKDRGTHVSMASKKWTRNQGMASDFMELGDALRDENTPDVEAVLDLEMCSEELAHIIRILLDDLDDPRYRVLVERRILADPPESLEDVGKRLNVSRERVRQIESVFHARLRKMITT